MAFDSETERRSLQLGVDAHADLVQEFYGRVFHDRAVQALKPVSERISDDQLKALVLDQMTRENGSLLGEEHCRTVWELFLESIESGFSE